MATYSSVLAWRIPEMGKAWWAAVYEVTHSWTRPKRLSSSSSYHQVQYSKSHEFLGFPVHIKVMITL